MKKSKKIIILIVVLLIIIIAITTTIFIIKKKKNPTEENQELALYDTKISEYVKETENGIKVNTNTQLNQEKKIDGLTVTGIQLTCKSGITTLNATVTNNTGASTKLQNVEAVFLDKDGKEFATAKGIVGALEIGASTTLNISMSSNYINAYDVAFRTI